MLAYQGLFFLTRLLTLFDVSHWHLMICWIDGDGSQIALEIILSVADTYCYCVVFRGEGDRYSGVTQHTQNIYKQLWGAQVPEKMKVTCWKYIYNFLPTKDNQFRRRIGVDRMCPHYGSGLETILHVCRDCPVVQEVWHGLGFYQHIVPESKPFNGLVNYSLLLRSIYTSLLSLPGLSGLLETS